MKVFSFIFLGLSVAVIGCGNSTSGSNPVSGDGSFGRIQGIAWVDGAPKENVTLQLIPSGQRTISGPDGRYSFDSVALGLYHMTLQEQDLAYDTVEEPISLKSATTLEFNPKIMSLIGYWYPIGVDLGSGSSVSGRMIIEADNRVGISYDLTSYVYGKWHLKENNFSMSVGGWDYSGKVTRSSISGTVFTGLATHPWSASRN